MSHRRPIRGHGDFGAPAFVPLTAHIARPSDAIDARQNGTSGRHDGGFGDIQGVRQRHSGLRTPVRLPSACGRPECYLREELLPPWPADFPMRQWAQAWTVARGKYEADPKDEAAKSARASFDALGK
jgi:hypothetical protein